MSGRFCIRSFVMPKPKSAFSYLRLIGGQWRGRKIAFQAAPGLRPTPDRVRETLFNWLMYDVPGARCLDLFAGSGALGFEAASREANQVVMVESNAATARQLKQQAGLLQADNIEVVPQSAESFLAGNPVPFDVVFLDPPFGQQWLEPVLKQLARGWLHAGSVLYLESEKSLPETEIGNALPDGFAIVRSKVAGDVGYRLARRV